MNNAHFFVIFWEIRQLYTSPDCFYEMLTHHFTGKTHQLLLIILLLSFSPSCMKERPESLPGEWEWNPEIAFPLGEEVFGMNSDSDFDTTLLLPDSITSLPAWINEEEVVMEGLLKFDFSPIGENLTRMNSITFRVNGYNRFPHMIFSQAYLLDGSMRVFDSLFAEGAVLTPAGAVGTDGRILRVGQASYDVTLEGDRLPPLEDLSALYFRATFSLEQVDTDLIPFYPQLDFTVDMGIMLDLSLEF